MIRKFAVKLSFIQGMWSFKIYNLTFKIYKNWQETFKIYKNSFSIIKS